MPHFTRLLFGATATVTVTCLAPGIPNRNAVLGVTAAHAQQSGAQAGTVTAAGVTLQSVTITLPTGDQLFAGGAVADAINSNCLACHSTGMVLTQPALPESGWKQEVDKMRVQYKAPVDEHAIPAIVAYLVAHKGAK